MFFRNKTPPKAKLYARNKNTTRFANRKGLAPKLGLVGKQTWPSETNNKNSPPRRLKVGDDKVTVFESKNLFSAIQYAIGYDTPSMRQAKFDMSNVNLSNLARFSKTLKSLPEVHRMDYLDNFSHDIVYGSTMSNQADEDALILGSLKYKRTVALYDVPSEVKIRVARGADRYRIEGVACMEYYEELGKPVTILKKGNRYAVLRSPGEAGCSLPTINNKNGRSVAQEAWVNLLAIENELNKNRNGSNLIDARLQDFCSTVSMAAKQYVRTLIGPHVSRLPAVIVSPSDGSYKVILPDGSITFVPCKYVTLRNTSNTSNIWKNVWDTLAGQTNKSAGPQMNVKPSMLRRVTEPEGTWGITKFFRRLVEPHRLYPKPVNAIPRRSVPARPSPNAANNTPNLAQLRMLMGNGFRGTNDELRNLYKMAKKQLLR